MNHPETIIRRYKRIDVIDVMATYFLVVTDVSGKVTIFPSKDLYDECVSQDEDDEVIMLSSDIDELSPVSITYQFDNTVPSVLVYDFMIERYIGYPEFDRIYNKHKLLHGTSSDSPSLDISINTGDDDSDLFVGAFINLYDYISLWGDFTYQNLSLPVLNVMKNIDSGEMFINDMIELFTLVIERSEQ